MSQFAVSLNDLIGFNSTSVYFITYSKLIMERNSNPGRKGGGGRGGRNPSKTTRSAPEGLLMLREDGANIMEWVTSLATHLQENYGSLGEFVETGSYPTRKQPGVVELKQRFPYLEAKDLRKILLDGTTDLLKQEKRDREDKYEMFSLLQQAVTTEGWNRVKARSGFGEAKANRDPNALLDIIKTEHSLKMNNVSDGEARYIAESRYNRIRMLPDMSLADFMDAFQMTVTNMETLGCEELPSSERQARHFLMKLDRDRYGDYMRDTINLDRNKTKDFPKTIQSVVDAARMHLPSSVNRNGQGRGTPMVYAGLSAEQLKRPCANCKQLGHWARECPEEDHRGEDNGADAQPDQLEDEKDSTANVAKAAPSKKKGGKSGKKNAYRMRADSYDDFDDIFGFAATSPKALGNMDPFLVCIDSLANMSFTFNEKL